MQTVSKNMIWEFTRALVQYLAMPKVLPEQLGNKDWADTRHLHRSCTPGNA